MKEPDKHKAYDGGDFIYCVKDGEPWPCGKQQEWRASPKFRLSEIERRQENCLKARDRVEKELRETKEQLRRLELLVRGGVIRSLNDKGRGTIIESVNVETDTRHLRDGRSVTVESGREYVVEYRGPNSHYRNNVLIEQWSGGDIGPYRGDPG